LVRRDGATAKAERIQEIAVIVMKALNNEGDQSLSKTIALLEFDIGLTAEKIMEYLRVLEKLGRFEIDEKNDKIKKISPS
jgi:hypothetical protein